jgi:hypothetical protein
MKVLFASGDVGGARAILPIIAVCEDMEMPFAVLCHGHIQTETLAHWEKIHLPQNSTANDFQKILEEHCIKVLVFASSIKDSVALSLARVAKKLGIVTIHVLDNWANYRERMERDGLETFLPAYYTVIDNLAFEEAVRSGIDPSIMVITGQPALAIIPDEYQKWKEQRTEERAERLGLNTGKKIIAFISEPAEQDQGKSIDYPTYRGYTEKIVLRLFCEYLQPFSDKLQVVVLPHPRENKGSLKIAWEEFHGSLAGGILQHGRGRDAVFLSDGVAGMTSILMYEAWLIGKPVISLQPGLRYEDLRILQNREGIVFVESYQEFGSSILKWIDMVFSEEMGKIRDELNMHKDAPAHIFRLIKKAFTGFDRIDSKD